MRPREDVVIFILFVDLVGPQGLLNLILNKYKTQRGNLEAVTRSQYSIGNLTCLTFSLGKLPGGDTESIPYLV